MKSRDPQDYLKAVLALDASTQLEKLACLRAEFRSNPGSAGADVDRPSPTPPPARPRRALLQSELARHRKSLATRTTADTRDQLERLDLAGRPDLERERARLVAVHDALDELERMLSDRELEAQLASDLARLVFDTPQQAIERRNQSVFAVGYALSSGAAMRFSRLVSARYPALSALEAEWLQRLESAKRDLRDSSMVGRGPGCGLIVLALSFVGLGCVGVPFDGWAG